MYHGKCSPLASSPGNLFSASPAAVYMMYEEITPFSKFTVSLANTIFARN
jgi:hypothetical protein